MFKPLNQLNAIFDSILDLNLSGNEQLVLFHLFDAFNRAHWTESLKLSDEMLKWRLNQYDSTGKPITIETIRRAKQKLKSKGLIDFTAGSGSRVTEYKLVKLYEDSPSGYPKNTPVDTPDRFHENTPDGVALLSIPFNRLNQEDGRREDTQTARGCVSGEPSFGNLDASVIAAWGEGLDWNNAYDLGALQERYGTDAVVKAINAAKNSLNGRKLTVAYVGGTLRRMKEEGENIGRNNSNERTERKTSGLQSDYDRAFGFGGDD